MAQGRALSTPDFMLPRLDDRLFGTGSMEYGAVGIGPSAIGTGIVRNATEVWSGGAWRDVSASEKGEGTSSGHTCAIAANSTTYCW